MNQRDENRTILKKVNRLSTGRRKPGMDGVKILIIMGILMTGIAVMLIVIGRLDFSGIGARAARDNYNGEEPYDVPDVIILDDFVPGAAVVLPGNGEWVFYPLYGGIFELPVNGSTGWAAVETALLEASRHDSAVITTLMPGTGFTIISITGEWWQVRLPDESTGWVDRRHCFINLPDVVPSIVFRNANAKEALFTAAGYALPGVTGRALYSAYAFNYRLGRYEYIVPVMYATARTLHTAQQAALAVGHTLVVYEGFRPRSAQIAVHDAMQRLMDTNETVYAGLEASAFSLSWFASAGISNQQRGAAVDAIMARVGDYTIVQSGEYAFLRITRYTDMHILSPVYELGPQSAITNTPQGLTLTDVLGDEAIIKGPAMTGDIAYMQRIFAEAGLRPLASKWWQFTHGPGVNTAASSGIEGDFYTPTIYSLPPSG